MRWWDQGSVTIEAGSPIVVGVGTAWLGNVAVGDRFSAPGCPAISVLRVESDERLVLKFPASRSGVGAAYEVLRQSEDDIAGAIAAFSRLVKAEAMAGARWTWALGGPAKGPSKDGYRIVAGRKLLSPAAWADAGGARRRRTEAPVVSSPTGGITLTQWPIALTVGACGCAAGWSRTRFQIARATDPGFTSPLYDGAGKTATTLLVYPILTGLGTSIIWRALFVDGAGRETDWSAPAACATPSAVPVPGLVQPAAGASVFPEYRFVVGGFYSWDGAALGTVRIQVTTATDTGFTSPLYDVEGADLTRDLTEETLPTFANYLWRARFTDDRGRVGAWASPVAFGTKSAIQKPTAAFPADGDYFVEAPYTPRLSEYVSGDGTAFAGVDLEITTGPDAAFSAPFHSYTGTSETIPLTTTPAGAISGPSPTDVCWSPDLKIFVAVGGNVGVAPSCGASADGKVWTKGNFPSGSNPRGVCWSSELGIFVAGRPDARGHAFAWSEDGENWSLSTTPASSYGWESVCWSPKLRLFAAASSYSQGVVTSPDGKTWTRRTIPNVGGAAPSYLNDVCWSPEAAKFCIVGENASGYPISLASSDGISWTGGTIGTGNGTIGGVCHVPGVGFIASGNTTGGTSNATAFIGPDGVSWPSSVNSISYNTGSGTNIAYSPRLKRVVIIGSSSASYSDDGYTWARAATPYGMSNLYSVCWSDALGVFLAVALTISSNNHNCFTSSDGKHWTGVLMWPWSGGIVNRWRGRYIDAKGRKSSFGDGAVYALAPPGFKKPSVLLPNGNTFTSTGLVVGPSTFDTCNVQDTWTYFYAFMTPVVSDTPDFGAVGTTITVGQSPSRTVTIPRPSTVGAYWVAVYIGSNTRHSEMSDPVVVYRT